MSHIVKCSVVVRSRYVSNEVKYFICTLFQCGSFISYLAASTDPLLYQYAFSTARKEKNWYKTSPLATNTQALFEPIRTVAMEFIQVLRIWTHLDLLITLANYRTLVSNYLKTLHVSRTAMISKARWFHKVFVMQCSFSVIICYRLDNYNIIIIIISIAITSNIKFCWSKFCTAKTFSMYYFSPLSISNKFYCEFWGKFAFKFWHDYHHVVNMV